MTANPVRNARYDMGEGQTVRQRLAALSALLTGERAIRR
jgi:hypothetical protein